MTRIRIFWRLYPVYLAVLLAGVGFVAFSDFKMIQRFYEQRARENLLEKTSFSEVAIKLVLERNQPERLQSMAEALRGNTGYRVTIIAPDGRVLADSDETPTRMENHLDRPEVRAALRQRGTVSAQRWSQTIQRGFLYAAQPVYGRDGALVCIIRVAIPQSALDEGVEILRLQILLVGGSMLLLLTLLSFFVARNFARPMEVMTRYAEQIAAGQFPPRLHIHHSAEVDRLADALNTMAVQLDERIRALSLQRRRMHAFFASMGEGVLAVDADRRVEIMNQAAVRLLGVDAGKVMGRRLIELVRHTGLCEAVEKALISGVPVDEEAVLRGRDGDVFLRVFVTRLDGEADARPGAVAVLSDITRLRRLENVRREFVANVSHELRTPVTSILGFVETLRGGALEDPEKARRFLDIVARHSERLAAIIDDLLLLARLESGEAVLERSSCAAIALLEGARQALQAKADERGVRICVDADPALKLNVNSSLVQQAVANLVDNAVKYSPAQSEVVLTAARAEDGRLLIRVTDRGAGIPAGHLPRLFERFYRVDKQRSREQGGTGLGLAIVKHIMQTHGGEVDVESRLGEGSTFTLMFPSV